MTTRWWRGAERERAFFCLCVAKVTLPPAYYSLPAKMQWANEYVQHSSDRLSRPLGKPPHRDSASSTDALSTISNSGAYARCYAYIIIQRAVAYFSPKPSNFLTLFSCLQGCASSSLEKPTPSRSFIHLRRKVSTLATCEKDKKKKKSEKKSGESDCASGNSRRNGTYISHEQIKSSR